MQRKSVHSAGSIPVALLALATLLACEPDAAMSSGTALATDAHGDGALQQCVGVTPPASAWTAKVGPEGVAGLAAPVLGAQGPTFALADFQPQSCGYRADYGLPTFTGRVTVVAILAGW